MNNILLNNLPLLVLNQIVSLLYLVTTFLYGAHFFSDIEFAKQYKRPLLSLTLVTHVLYLGLLTSIEGYKISYSTVNLMTMVALTLTIIYLFIEFTTKSDKTGFFVISFASGAQLISSVLTSLTPNTGTAFSGIGIGVHLITTIFGFSSIAIAGLYSILYLLLFRQIEQNRFELLFQRLPNLEVLERLIMHAVAFGFLFLSITLFAGVVEQHAIKGTVTILEPKLITLVIIWLIYGASIFIKPIIGWDIKHMAYLFIFLFVFVTALIVLMTFFSPTFHTLSF
ncbi:cytochrome c biogenesis protein CcsA [Chlorobium sp. BLA1]|uniref:cytochrome C assembly family protein n=1 Tax=Candidatus Chlorobium masyuteum TaxID=2716876 RepID=UPI00141F7069|nr:cytochrome c biogenesis protein CcsA [Candidatus Chlorobium masyuteum]NHQ61210.1 cytochrome c biogenesis protein CcsA [Candidatus Chlorobium masyuteum]NTU44452.1 cytochrome c biogenesis protein CcsA [Chlorobiaceae bacterium]